jgi:hypothetical protein
MMGGLYRHVERPEASIMEKPTREYCLAKIAELERKIEGCSEESLPDYLVMIECWRWLAERAGDRVD